MFILHIVEQVYGFLILEYPYEFEKKFGVVVRIIVTLIDQKIIQIDVVILMLLKLKLELEEYVINNFNYLLLLKKTIRFLNCTYKSVVNKKNKYKNKIKIEK
jgi:hypothetical protein